MSRHNRRRVRGGRKASNYPSRPFESDSCSFSTTPLESSSNPYTLSRTLSTSRLALSASTRLWYNRWNAWQARDRRQCQEIAKLEAGKRRLFGEDDGSDRDDILCVRMLEYFGGLDFIEP